MTSQTLKSYMDKKKQEDAEPSIVKFKYMGYEIKLYSHPMLPEGWAMVSPDIYEKIKKYFEEKDKQ